MQLADYTANAICRSMGLGDFVPEGPPCIRVLLKPSFHPEVCITLTESKDADSAVLSIVTLTEMLWREPFPKRIKELNSQVTLPIKAFTESIAGFQTALAEFSTECNVFSLDGMRVECCHLTPVGVERFTGVVSRPAISAFINHVVWWAWATCPDPKIHNAIVHIATYLGNNYQRFANTNDPPARSLLIIGNKDSREDYFRYLKSRGVL